MATYQTSLSLTLEAATLQEQYNECATAILRHKILLAFVLKGCVGEFKDCTTSYIEKECIEADLCIGSMAVHANTSVQENVREEAVENPATPRNTRKEADANSLIKGGTTEITFIGEGRTTFDLLFHATTRHKMRHDVLCIDIEFQKDSTKLGYPLSKRGGYYVARMISSQYGTVFTDSEYGKIQKVYSIWICPNPAKRRRDSIVEFPISPKFLHGRCKLKLSQYDILSIIVISLPENYTDSENQLIRLLVVLFKWNQSFEEKKKVLEEEFGIPMTYELKEDIEKMCNLGEGIYEQGVKDGEKKGEKRGKRRGIKIGERKGVQQQMVADAKGMYAEGLSVDAIARVQKVTVDAVHQMIGLQPG